MLMFLLRSPALQPSELVIATDNAQELMLLINKAVHNRQQSFNGKVDIKSHQFIHAMAEVIMF